MGHGGGSSRGRSSRGRISSQRSQRPSRTTSSIASRTTITSKQSRAKAQAKSSSSPRKSNVTVSRKGGQSVGTFRTVTTARKPQLPEGRTGGVRIGTISPSGVRSPTRTVSVARATQLARTGTSAQITNVIQGGTVSSARLVSAQQQASVPKLSVSSSSKGLSQEQQRRFVAGVKFRPEDKRSLSLQQALTLGRKAGATNFPTTAKGIRESKFLGEGAKAEFSLKNVKKLEKELTESSDDRQFFQAVQSIASGKAKTLEKGVDLGVKVRDRQFKNVEIKVNQIDKIVDKYNIAVKNENFEKANKLVDEFNQKDVERQLLVDKLNKTQANVDSLVDKHNKVVTDKSLKFGQGFLAGEQKKAEQQEQLVEVFENRRDAFVERLKETEAERIIAESPQEFAGRKAGELTFKSPSDAGRVFGGGIALTQAVGLNEPSVARDVVGGVGTFGASALTGLELGAEGVAFGLRKTQPIVQTGQEVFNRIVPNKKEQTQFLERLTGKKTSERVKRIDRFSLFNQKPIKDLTAQEKVFGSEVGGLVVSSVVGAGVLKQLSKKAISTAQSKLSIEALKPIKIKGTTDLTTFIGKSVRSPSFKITLEGGKTLSKIPRQLRLSANQKVQSIILDKPIAHQFIKTIDSSAITINSRKIVSGLKVKGGEKITQTFKIGQELKPQLVLSDIKGKVVRVLDKPFISPRLRTFLPEVKKFAKQSKVKPRLASPDEFFGSSKTIVQPFKSQILVERKVGKGVTERLFKEESFIFGKTKASKFPFTKLEEQTVFGTIKTTGRSIAGKKRIKVLSEFSGEFKTPTGIIKIKPTKIEVKADIVIPKEFSGGKNLSSIISKAERTAQQQIQKQQVSIIGDVLQSQKAVSIPLQKQATKEAFKGGAIIGGGTATDFEERIFAPSSSKVRTQQATKTLSVSRAKGFVSPQAIQQISVPSFAGRTTAFQVPTEINITPTRAKTIIKQISPIRSKNVLKNIGIAVPTVRPTTKALIVPKVSFKLQSTLTSSTITKNPLKSPTIPRTFTPSVPRTISPTALKIFTFNPPKPILRTPTITTTKVPPIFKIPPLIPITPRTPPPFFLPKSPLQSKKGRVPKAFRVPLVNIITKFKGKDVVLFKKVPKPIALSKGAKFIDFTPRASFKLVDTGKTTVISKKLKDSFNVKDFSKVFRVGKKGFFVERRKFRISTAGELKGITFKGLEAKKKKKNILDFFIGKKKVKKKAKTKKRKAGRR